MHHKGRLQMNSMEYRIYSVYSYFTKKKQNNYNIICFIGGMVLRKFEWSHIILNTTEIDINNWDVLQNFSYKLLGMRHLLFIY